MISGISILNILFLSTENPFPVDHGHHIRTYHVLKALAAEHKIHFIGFTQNDSGFDHKDKLFEFCETVDILRLRYRGWRQLLLSVFNLFSQMPLIIQKYYTDEAVERVHQVIQRHKIDLVHFDMLHLAKYRDCIGSLPCILVNHNVESLRLRRWASIEKKKLLKLFLNYQYTKLRNYESQACLEFDKCVVVSEDDKAFLRDLCNGGDFVTLPNGVDAGYFQVSTDRVEPNTLVWTGSLRSPYNRDAVVFLLNFIWPRIYQKLPEARLTIVGALPSKPLDVPVGAERVSFTGYVDDVRPYVAKSALFVAPLRSGSGTKIKVLNAMSQGKAVLTTTIGVEGIDAIHSNEIVVIDNPEQFADRAVALLQEPEEILKIGKRARKLIEAKYDWAIINRDISALYHPFARSVREEHRSINPVLE